MVFEGVNSGKQRMAKSSKSVSFRGYTKKEGDRWVAICIDLNIVAQGSTVKEATEECYALIVEYLLYVRTEYPQELHKYIPRPAPEDLVNEYYLRMIRSIRPAQQRLKPGNPLNFDIETPTLTPCGA